jgi:selenide,water dikinase
MIDIERRRRVMERSVKLGHCICNPKKPCPCDVFREQNVCLCAGEKLPDLSADVPLTSLVKNAGCASKINQTDLKRALGGLSPVTDPRVLVGSNTGDDAGVFQLDEETALVQTVDVFTPSVDDPYTFGQIAAANSVSDVYAMGGQPITALAVIGFPVENLDLAMMTQIMRGGTDKLAEAGVPIIGGHSINDLDVKFGFAVTGLIDPRQIITNAAARPGDALILTKPLGVGVIAFAAQLGHATPEAVAAAAHWMTFLNKTASELMREAGVICATDVTGFGLLGHLSEMVAQSGVTAEIAADRVPVLADALQYARESYISGGAERNREHARQRLQIEGDVAEELLSLLLDPQTSGGLLICVPQERAEALLARLRETGHDCAAIIGRITEESEGKIIVKQEGQPQEQRCCGAQAEETAPCCGSESAEAQPQRGCCAARAAEAGAEPGGGSCCAKRGGDAEREPCCAERATLGEKTTEAASLFGIFMEEANRPGALDAKMKELLSVALSIVTKCEPCLKIHLNKARQVGLTEEEIEEAAWLGIQFGGAPAMMFYRSVTTP